MASSTRLVELLDVSDASEGEISEIKDALTLTCNEALTEAMEIISEGVFYGCPHAHLIIALQDLQRKFPCDDCSPVTPKKRSMN